MEKITIFTHGEASGNPGPAAIGVCFVDSKNNVIKEISESIGNATNDYAEYFAVVRGLQTLVDLYAESTNEMEFELKLDNELVKKQLSAEEQIKNVGLIGHFIEIYNLRVANFQTLKVTLIKKGENKAVGILVNKALDSR
jgi:ribonuclease HI